MSHRHAQEIRVDARPERAREAAEASLRRLGADAIDLWYLHFPDPGVPVEESVGAMGELVAEGKVRHLGLCNATAEQVLAAHQAHPLAAVQAEYSLWTREPERELLPVLRRARASASCAWSPLGAGFFAGGVAGRAAERLPGQPPALPAARTSPRNRDRYAPLRGLAAELEITPGPARARLAAASGARTSCPIPGTRTPSHLDENLARRRRGARRGHARADRRARARPARPRARRC